MSLPSPPPDPTFATPPTGAAGEPTLLGEELEGAGGFLLTPEQRHLRLERRLRYVLQHLEVRTAQSEALQASIAELESENARLRVRCQVLSHERDALAGDAAAARKAYEALLRTKSFRLLRAPRALYGKLLRLGQAGSR